MSEEKTETAAAPELATPERIEDLEPKTRVRGRVDKLELYGAFIDIGVGVNALIHISQLGDGRVNRVTDVLKEGDEIEVWVDKVDVENQQIMVTMLEPVAVDWGDLKEKQVYTGKVTRLESFGAFVDIGAEREGLVHISELSHDYVKHPSEVARVGDEVQVQILGYSKRKRRIDLSMKALTEKPESAPSTYNYSSGGGRGRRQVEEVVDYQDDDEALPTAMEVALRKAMGDEKIDELATDRRSRRGGKRRRRKEQRQRDQQEDLLNRTLQLQD